VRVCELSSEYGRYGYRRVTALLRSEGWGVNHKRVERIWRQEGLKVPQKQQKRRRLWLNDTASIRLRPVRRNHVWSYDFVHDRTHDGRSYRILVIIDEFTRECLALNVSRKWCSDEVIHTLTELFCTKGKPEYIRSDNGAELRAKVVRSWLGELEVAPLYIEAGSPWENGYVESFNGKMRDELLNREQIDTMREAQVLLEQWRQHYNTRRPHSSLGYRPPAPEAKPPAIMPMAVAETR
jgi:putative transposase